MHKLLRIWTQIGLRFPNSERLNGRHGLRFNINSEAMSTHKRSAGTAPDNCVTKKACGALAHIGAENTSLAVKEQSKQSEGDMQIVQRNELEILEAPDKSEKDRKLYRVIRLNNGLKALLIYDPVADAKTIADFSKCNVKVNAVNVNAAVSSDDDEESGSEASDDEEDGTEGDAHEKLAACSLSVDVGSFSDPRDVQGLAHFLGKTNKQRSLVPRGLMFSKH